MSLALVCRRCGYQAPPAVFDDAAAAQSFRQAREALWHPGDGHGHEQDPFAARARQQPAPTRKRGALGRGLLALLGFVFVADAVFAAWTIAVTGGSAWAALLPNLVLAVLLGVPLVVAAARR